MAAPRLLVVGETAVPTGYARVADSLLEPLGAAFDVHQLSLWPEATLGPARWPTWFRDARRPLPEQFAELADELRPDIVLILHDLRTVASMAEALEARRDWLRSASYSPLDALPPRSELVLRLRAVDRVVAYTEDQAHAIRNVFAGDGAAPHVEVIPHGVDTGRFYPLDHGGARTRARGRVFGGRCPPGAFVVLNANRNHVRKRIDLTVEAFSLFSRTRPDALLCLHCGARDAMGWDLGALIRRHGVADRVLLTAPDLALPDADDERLNLVYNACDVGLNTSVGEGWGLASFEHAATGAAQVVPDHTACGELWRGHGVCVPASVPLPTANPYRDERRVHPDDVADALGALYDDRASLRKWSNAAYGLATRKGYSWKSIASRWGSLMNRMLTGRQAHP